MPFDIQRAAVIGAGTMGRGIVMCLANVGVPVQWVYLNGYGFPADNGGPMAWADQQGLANIHERLLRLEAEQGDLWKPARLIGELAAVGKGFADR